MSEELIENGSLNGNGTTSSVAEKESLLKIRDILFGDQVQELSARIKTTEAEFNKQLGLLKSIQTRSTTALKDKVANHRIENRELVKTSLAKLEQKLETELASLKSDLGNLASQQKEQSNQIAKDNSALAKRLAGIEARIADVSKSSVRKSELAQTLRVVAEGIK